MASIPWGRKIADVYDETGASMFESSVVDPTAQTLAALAQGGNALEFAIGTGRIALPLRRLGVQVHGIELSPHMVAKLREKPGAEAIPVTIGDMSSTRVEGAFQLVYLVYNTIMNLTTQQEQVDVFANAAAHLVDRGCFVVEVMVPQLNRLPPGDVGRVFAMKADHIGIETFDDLVGQISWSHHWMDVGGRLFKDSMPFRYIWPSELVLMAQLAGFRLRDRWANWVGDVFTGTSTHQIAVFEKLA